MSTADQFQAARLCGDTLNMITHSGLSEWKTSLMNHLHINFDLKM